jgi:Clr5 domain
MTSFVPSPFVTGKSKARRYSAQEWEVQKGNVERLYITENKPLKEVIQILERDFGFFAR